MRIFVVCGLLQNQTVGLAQLRHHVFQHVAVRRHAAHARARAASDGIQLSLAGTSSGLAAEDGVEAEHRR